MKNKPIYITFLLGLIICLLLFILNLSIGSVHIPFPDIASRITGKPFLKASWETILMEFRLPKAITAILAGINLSISGLQMQTFFRNPLAGPYVLGISSGAGLGVAIMVMASTAFGWVIYFGQLGVWSIIISASLGAILVLLLISFTAWRVRDSMTLLIVGLMFGSAVSAIVAVLSYFSGAEQLKLFTVWSMGSLGISSYTQLLGLLIASLLGLLPALFLLKSYNAMLLGEAYAESMGINIKRLRWGIILSTGILAGSTTAICGPIAFIGIAVPHMARLIFKSGDHRILLPGSAIAGAIIMLFCDAISQLPGSAQTLPINAVTSLIGAPMVIWLILRRNFSKEF
ncbi:iron ABC transporter permease [Cecembia calidifontis]|uniref:Iron complex transport system permease protein n=1 Tax=Cecembia calidifontis TaxID=1187080 RepID=A0A4V2F6K1_9BACT|nr:iron ABC transporter permease [Cecembia calidifontis]RZS96599.1 iron complex transport system permease protein [Cecembia calidifontis]